MDKKIKKWVTCPVHPSNKYMKIESCKGGEFYCKDCNIVWHIDIDDDGIKIRPEKKL